MLSDNSSTTLRQQRLHRRTQSTMDSYAATDTPSIPNTNTQRLSMHRRGISLDNRRPTSAQEHYSNSDFPQQTMRGLQQQRLQHNQSSFFYNPTNEENYLISPGMTPQRQSFEGMQRQPFDSGNLMGVFGAPMQPHPHTQFPSTLSLEARPVTADGNMNANQFSSQESSFYSQENGAITPSAYIDFTQALESLNDDWGATIKPVSRPNSRPLSRNFARQFDVPGTASSSARHLTPPSADSSSYFPSPSATPFDGTVKIEASGTIPRRFQEDYDMSLEDTIKPSRRCSPHKSNFQQMREQAEYETTAGHARMPPSAFFAPPSAPSSLTPPRPTTQLSNYGSENAYNSESDARSDRESPEMFKMQTYSNPLSARQIQTSYPELSGSEHSRESSPDMNYHARQRTLSIVSLGSSHNPDENIQDTGISMHDIAQYISGPDPADQKYLCLFPDCQKRFGRKENIKSHVQTHLGDRQFQCPHCSKCFVRQHDLKRHAKIHSGVKPYPCKCGNSFARHDALTRHRQRGMCVGAFEGVVKKVVKRGRPRKQRPDDDERHDKAEQSRSRARVKKERSNTTMSDASCSESDYSRSSYSMSPAPRDFSAQPSPFAPTPVPNLFSADSTNFSDFVAANPFRNESPLRQQVQAQAQQAELERISRNIFGDDAPPEFALHPPSSLAGPSCVSTAAMLGGPPIGTFSTSGGVEEDTHMAGGTIKALKSSSSRSVVSNTSPPGLTDSFNDSSPAELSNFYEPTPDHESMFIDFGEDNSPTTSLSLAQEASLLTLDGGIGVDVKGGFGGGNMSGRGLNDELSDVKGGFGSEFDVDPADISLFNEGEGNSWLL